jgi:hypothetical protein
MLYPVELRAQASAECPLIMSIFSQALKIRRNAYELKHNDALINRIAKIAPAHFPPPKPAPSLSQA